ncbi:sigma-54-dependent Fis family transcriptional regulator [Fictibacillus terranigra]|uniref:Sigma-54-dependent Fis family transcriptional regulator n=1 Tax=Fictibacillus terranigra TaxID=3058424 RepID=A0ABT8EDC6_9BACL|nr:sigma-54-dependent Fis family transcriptional regulator [Fictibacillus sp. CENA-BCM004]MDN4075939.1 sigma-54-dependent Fis family transcriptional regulator [Fictibacillus sp. CENA-BCM004]
MVGSNEQLLKSWARSQMYRPSFTSAKDAILSEYEFKQYKEKKEAFLNDIHPTIEQLAHRIKPSGSVVIISDTNSFILENIGEPKFLEDTKRIYLQNGACYSEKIRGTNSLGTVSIEKKTLAVVGKEHYLEAHHKLYCIGSPIFDPSGTLLAVLNISGYKDLYQPQMLCMIDNMARTIEDSFLIRQPNPQLILSLSSEQQPNYQALLALNEDGLITGANREARNLLNLETLIPEKIHIDDVLIGANSILNGEVHKGLIFLHKKDNEQSRLLCSIWHDSRIPLFTFSKDNSQSKPSVNSKQPMRNNNDAFNNIYGEDEVFQKVIDTARNASSTNYMIMVTGESGTGKDMISQAIHYSSSRSNKPFVALNCGGITNSLMESELFGYEAGAFTGAKQSGHPGKFEQANGGTLFLDEIGEMPKEMQIALLRVLQDFTITRIGGIKPIDLDVRIITATHTDLWKKVQEGSFRSDLFYRLQGVRIMLPPFRERTDRLNLAELLLKQVEKELENKTLTFSAEAKHLIGTYTWPGNVRQVLGALREAAFLSKDGLVDIDCFPTYILSSYQQPKIKNSSLKHKESQEIIEVLKKTDGNISESARILGIGRTTLYRKIKKLSNFIDE